MKGSGKPAKPMGKFGKIAHIPSKPKMSKKAISSTPSNGLRSPKAGPNRGM